MKRELNFEINILPILDILSVLICFLLLTAVWTQIGSLDTRQAIGDNSVSGDENPPSLWTMLDEQGNLNLELRNVTTHVPHAFRIASQGQGVDLVSLRQQLDGLKREVPNLKTAIIRPTANANYGDVIQLMDQMKQSQISDVGLSPLG